jgi:hypothetical protein
MCSLRRSSSRVSLRRPCWAFAASGCECVAGAPYSLDHQIELCNV